MLASAAGSVAHAQDRMPPQIGYLIDRTGPGLLDAAFLRGLREHGYILGQTISVEYRWTDGHTERLSAFAADLVARRVKLIVTQGAAATRAAMAETKTIPIVMASTQDAVADGLVASLARPGGNVTGRSVYARELTAKRLELLKEAIPGLSRVAVLWNAAAAGVPGQLREAEAAAAALRLAVVPVEVRIPQGLDEGVRGAKAAGAGAVLILSDSITIQNRYEIGEAALRHRLPSMFANKIYVEGGGLLSYGPDLAESFRLAAAHVDKILKGANPADLPVEQPTRFDLTINLKTEKALGLTLPERFRARADEMMQ
ncbi:MAG: ABC transporter substrate-binding protein [Alphaproteobacteria bacterium]|nr:ABC transporter substrate-binding protein [Alphaproteobacteria bacterium]MCW5743157.1 ABC transporter substrate-binding protein [Alphaproteobacteria bacterium]